MTSMPPHLCLRGQPWPLGATPMAWQGQEGVNLAVFSRHAAAVHWCLFDEATGGERQRIALPACTDGVWHGFLPGLRTGQLYGLRASGPYEPAAGHRFNPAKLLIDPYARELAGDAGDLSNEIGCALDASGHEQPDPQDNAARIPKARVVDLRRELAAGAAIAPGPRIAPDRTVLYEAHVKGLTRAHPGVADRLRGTYAGLASDAMLAHYARLGITSLCLLPVHQHIDEKHLLERGLTNYWGYNTLAYFIPEPGYAAARGAAAVRDEFRTMVDRLHRSGLEVVLDVVYNHTAEGDARGPTLSWRGLDNASWYALDSAGQYLNFTGCGNAINAGEPRVLQFVMDSLRWWVQAFGVDGFRFDLASTLGRDALLHHRFHPAGALIAAILQDPVLSRVKLIAEPWDVGPRGYQLGAFPAGWQEWNDRFRDTARSFWLGHDCTAGLMARRMTGSNDLFHHHGRAPLASVNMVTAHDGFTLADLTAYRHRHNEANGEHNRDGHSPNYSANAGVEGPSRNPAVLRQRAAWRRALLATLFLAQGTPQLLAGDELGNSQQGNNNAYCQDNATGWLDWAHADEALVLLVGQLASLRNRHPALRHPRWFEGRYAREATDAYAPGADIAWLRPDGRVMSQRDWDDAHERSFGYVIEVGEESRAAAERVMVLLHPGHSALAFALPPGAWRLVLDSGAPERDGERTFSGSIELAGPAVGVLVQAIDRGTEPGA
ncbi:MAG: glycogen debranching protein GlgX [Ramlibacter sp.]|nr:glycogen debranching protein GlgX [Ramlibacter sp.]